MRGAVLRSAGAALLLVLAACAGGPPPPDWQANANSALREAASTYLKGDARVADILFAQARREIARSGRLDLIARAELVRCAARVASLEFDACPGFTAVAADAGGEEIAYARYLGGEREGIDPLQLPVQHRPLLREGPVPAAALGAIEDPLARLVAAGVLLRASRLPPEGLALAVDAASANGWRRPLLAWLGVQLRRAEAAGEGETAAHLRRRIDLVSGDIAKTGQPAQRAD